jgi:DNA-nicking Smr family endonuclease
LPRVRTLSPEESALWAKVASTIRPLSRERNDRQATEVVEEAKAAPKLVRPVGAVPVQTPKRMGAGSSTLDGSWDKRLRSGSAIPDRIVDLHGMSLESAWRTIDRALEQAIMHGERLVVLITGHHRPGEPPIRRGAIRAAVHDWLAASRHAADIAAVRGAHRRHGGGGSLYIVLRRRREPR